MTALVFAGLLLFLAMVVLIYIVIGDLVDRRRKRLAAWDARTLVGLHTSEVQIQLIYLSKRGREYIVKRQIVGSVYAADREHDEEVKRLMKQARVRAFEMNMGGT